MAKEKKEKRDGREVLGSGMARKTANILSAHNQAMQKRLDAILGNTKKPKN